MPNKKFFFFILLLTTTLIAEYWVIESNSLTLRSISERHQRGSLDLSPEESSAMRKELKWRVESYGYEETYKYLRANFSQQGSAINHSIQHYFGEMVYDKMGFQGIKFCGYSYPNGCSHGLILKTIEKEGYETAVKKVIDSCSVSGDAKLSCVHILGHEFEIKHGVKVALDKCSGLNLGTPFTNCASGVFMQYYFPNIYEGGEEIQMRKFEKDHFYDLCEPLSGESRRACTLFTIEWWQFGLNKDYSKVFELCNRLSNNDRTDCIKGVGVMAADNFSSDTTEINKVCTIVSDHDRQLQCLSGALKFLIANDKKESVEAAKYLCADNWQKCLALSQTVFY